MALTYSALPNKGILLLGKDILTAEDLLQVNKQIYHNDEAIQNIRYQICDYTDVEDVQISSEEIILISKQDKMAANINPTMVIAVVAMDNVTYGMSRMWEAYSTDSPLKTAVFHTIEQAKEWIASELKVKPFQ